jgi:hypothetical protein
MRKNAMENVGETKRKSIESGVKPRKKNRCIGSFQKRSIPPPRRKSALSSGGGGGGKCLRMSKGGGGGGKCLRMSKGGGEMRIYDCPKG